jgi:hypothetical protein
MKGTKIVGMVLAVAVMIFVIAPIASAQSNILNGQWFKIKLGLKGYRIADDGTVIGKGSGSKAAYLYFAYSDAGGAHYTITTCTAGDLDDVWRGSGVDAVIYLDESIYGATYPQVWEFADIPLVFYDRSSIFRAYPTIYTKITTKDGTLKSASISNVACVLSADLLDDEEATYAAGSCSISGSLVSEANVAKGKVPADCLLLP